MRSANHGVAIVTNDIREDRQGPSHRVAAAPRLKSVSSRMQFDLRERMLASSLPSSLLALPYSVSKITRMDCYDWDRFEARATAVLCYSRAFWLAYCTSFLYCCSLTEGWGLCCSVSVIRIVSGRSEAFGSSNGLRWTGSVFDASEGEYVS